MPGFPHFKMFVNSARRWIRRYEIARKSETTANVWTFVGNATAMVFQHEFRMDTSGAFTSRSYVDSDSVEIRR